MPCHLRAPQSRVDKIEAGTILLRGTVTVANWMFRSTMDGKVQSLFAPELSIEYPNKARTDLWNPFQALTASEFTLQDQELRHEPAWNTMDVSVNGFAATPVSSKAKEGVAQMLDLRLPTTLVYCRMICFGSKRKKGFGWWSKEICKRAGNLGRGDLDDQIWTIVGIKDGEGNFRMG